MKQIISIPATKMAGYEQLEYKKDLLKDKLLQNKVNPEHFRRMPFVTFFLYTLLTYFVLTAFAELYLTFSIHSINWIVYNEEAIYNIGFYDFAYIELITGILSMTNAIAMYLILKSKRNGFWIIACGCTITLFILALYTQYFNIEYNSIGNLVLLKNLFIPFILWAVLNFKNDNGESQWQSLK